MQHLPLQQILLFCSKMPADNADPDATSVCPVSRISSFRAAILPSLQRENLPEGILVPRVISSALLVTTLVVAA